MQLKETFHSTTTTTATDNNCFLLETVSFRISSELKCERLQVIDNRAARSTVTKGALWSDYIVDCCSQDQEGTFNLN